MKNNFESAFSLTLKYEGGYVDHPKDPGGATNLGVTIGVLSSHLGRQATKDEVRALTPAKVKPIYKRRYWDKVQADRLPAGLDLVVYDFAVNSGPARAAKYLQKMIGVRQDGVIGDDTIAAIAASGMSPRAMVAKYCDMRVSFLRSLRTFGTFGRGWLRRVEHVRSTGLAWADGDDDFGFDVDDIETGSVKARDTDVSKLKLPDMKAASLASVGTIGAAATEAADKLSAYSDTLDVIKYVFIALTLVGVGVGLYVAWKRASTGQFD